MYKQVYEHIDICFRIQPDDIGSHINVGRVYNTLDQPVEAEQAFRRALDLFPPVKPGQSYTARVAPNHLNVFINLGSLIAKDESRLAEADTVSVVLLGGLHVTNPPIRLMGPTSIHLSVRPHFRFRTLTRKRFVQSNPNLTGR